MDRRRDKNLIVDVYKRQGQYHTICGTVEFFDPSIHLRIDDTIILIPDLCELSGRCV